jgi:hypothetical protein
MANENQAPAQQAQPSAIQRITTKAWNKFADWSVEVFIGAIIIAAIAGIWFARAYIPIFNH